MFDRRPGIVLAASFFFLLYGEQISAAGPPDSNGPFAGRLIISILGAGEKPNEHYRFWATRRDVVEFEATFHLKQFSPNRKPSLPVQIVAVSSDREFPDVAANMAKLSGASLAGVEPNWVGTLSRLVTEPTSSLGRAIRTFESNPNCQKLMRSGNLGSVLPLLKVEILIDAESAVSAKEPGIPSWSSQEKRGTFADWLNDGGRVLTKEEWSVLLTSLRGALVHAFFNSCKSGRVAAAFEKAADEQACYSCFVASTHPLQNDYSGGDWAPTFNYAMPDSGKKNFETKPNTWIGAPNIVSILPDLYRKYRELILPFTSADVTPYSVLSSVMTPRNPLSSFIYDSADALAEEGLRKLGNVENLDRGETPPDFLKIDQIEQLRRSDDIKDLAKVTVYAQAMSELPHVACRQIHDESGIEKMILERVDRIDRSYSAVLEETEKPITEAQFTTGINLFTDCTKDSAKKSPQCEALTALINRIYAKTLSDAEAKLKWHYSRYFDLVKANDPRQEWNAYVAGTKTASMVFENLQGGQEAWSKMKPALAAVIAEQPPESSRPMKEALDYMTTHFAGAYASIQDRMFQDLRKDAIRLKLAKIRLSTHLVAENADALPPGYSEKFLKRMAQKLDCLTQYPVGPAFDAKYGKK
jgi:hypothetical protein